MTRPVTASHSAPAPTPAASSSGIATTKPTLSSGLVKHLWGLSIGHGDGYLALINAYERYSSHGNTCRFTNARGDDSNSVILTVKKISGIFIKDCELKHTHKDETATLKIPAAILPGVQADNSITIKKNIISPSADRAPCTSYTIIYNKQTLFTLRQWRDEGYHLIQGLLTDGFDHSKKLLKLFESPAVSLKSIRDIQSTITGKLNSNNLFAIFTTIIEKDFNKPLNTNEYVDSSYIADLVLQICKDEFTNEAVNTLVNKAIEKNTVNSLYIAYLLLGHYSSAKYIFTDNHRLDLSGSNIVEAAIKLCTKESLKLATKLLHPSSKLTFTDCDMASFARKIVEVAITQDTSSFLGLAQHTLLSLTSTQKGILDNSLKATGQSYLSLNEKIGEKFSKKMTTKGTKSGSDSSSTPI